MAERTKKLVDILLQEELVTKPRLDEALAEQKLTGAPIQKILVDKGYITSSGLAQALARQLEIPYVKLIGQKIAPQVIKMIPEDIARQYKAIPVKMEGDSLHVAFASPLNLPARDEIKLITGCRISPMAATEKEIEQAIDQYYRVEETSKQALIDMRMQKLKEKKKEKAVTLEEELGRVGDLPVVRLVNDVINGAINAKASDIHFEPQDPEMVVRYRVDGILRDVMTVPKHVELSVISRIKILSNLDITERRLPQDGHISFKKDVKNYDLRVSTLKTVVGEKAVLRVLDKASMLIDLEKLGFTKHDEDIFKSLISKPYGMILVTGPTGSGKTTTLYAVLNQMNAVTDNIVTIENPVEYMLSRINQIQVDPTTKITFAAGLRTILRQDPDKIMVGEIRDRETAEVAVQAALTGHLVLSTLHTNDAAGAVTRAIDMGIEPFLISSTVIGTLAQRLCRMICPECKEEYTPSKKEIESIGLEDLPSGQQLARGRGCDYCYGTGFRGRSAIFEIMKMSDGLRKLILDRAPLLEIKELAIKEGMKTLRENSIRKVLDKVSTIEEVRRVVYMD
ncbi:MAG: GspE/PulE family protein [Candidatus Omnitrophica bacterium]|nr:GspE/PulE family protein [Candidatus Omnitrophota bacterium]MBU1128381.1 GspE/PulE family protein [Candidatus Omnitrophota bacterium]MBU1784627.1 GspE/PulE family protein [Candidatus Omnitrophota bacterium]MBU1850873.1 GspE/PulE family protein [Candidatus Omnitrophota bacterium]